MLKETKMKIEGTNPKTGKSYNVDSDSIDDGFIRAMQKFEFSEKQVKRFIDNLDVSADTKALLYSFTKTTLKVGNIIIKIGAKIIDIVFTLFREFPSATFGMILGAIAGTLIASIPVLGAVLGPFFTPLAVLFGLAKGATEDIKDKALARKVAEANAKFSPLHGS